MNNLASYIDHTVLKPNAVKSDIETLCKQAVEYSFTSVCVNPCFVSFASSLLKNSNVKVCAVIGFPLGANKTSVKAYETSEAVSDGASEIDMVINIGALKDKDVEYVTRDIKAVVDAAGKKADVKVIIEACLLTDSEKILASQAAANAGAAFVKTSTGFSTGGATVHDVELMKKAVGNSLKVKAAGGIKTREFAIELIKAGADRLGTSSGVKLVDNQDK